MKNPAVLLVGPGARRQALTSNLDLMGMEILYATDWRGARQVLQRRDVAVAVTDLTLHDGNWSDVVQHAAQRDFQTSVVVVSRTSSARLWAELLWRGAHDLLIEPLNDREVRQVVEGALRAAETARGGPARRTVPPRAIPAANPASAS